MIRLLQAQGLGEPTFLEFKGYDMAVSHVNEQDILTGLNPLPATLTS